MKMRTALGFLAAMAMWACPACEKKAEPNRPEDEQGTVESEGPPCVFASEPLEKLQPIIEDQSKIIAPGAAAEPPPSATTASAATATAPAASFLS